VAVTIDEISALTEKLYLPIIADNFFDSNPLLARMHDRGLRKDGGTAVHAPLLYAATGAAGAIRGFEPMTIDPDDQITAVDFGWKEYYAAIVLSKREMLINSGVPRKISHLEAKSQVSEMTLRNLIGVGMQSDGLSTRLVEGLEAIVQTTGTYPNTSAGDNTIGIDCGVETWWQAAFRGTSTGLIGAAIGADGANAARALQVLTGRASEAPFGPTIYLTTQEGFNRIHNGMTVVGAAGTGTGGQQGMFTDAHLASLGYEIINFRGKPIVVDSHVLVGAGGGTDPRLYALNENFLDLVSHEEEDFVFEPYRMPVNQKAMVGYVFWTGAMICNNRRFQATLTSFA
jgi:hypothetical protein